MERIYEKNKKINTLDSPRSFEPKKKASKNSKLAVEFTIITTSFHEAGHALVALLKCAFVNSVSLQINHKKKVSSSADLGAAHYDPVRELDKVTDPELLNQLLLDDIAIFHAGLAAEKLFYKEICGTEHLPSFIKDGSQADFGYVSEIITKYNLAPPGKKRYAFKKKCFRKAQRLLSENWSDVKLIAHALFEKKKLYYTDLKELLSKKSQNKKFWKEQFKTIDILNSEKELSDYQVKKLLKL